MAAPPRIAIIGGGIAGLAAAWELRGPAALGHCEVDLFEASARWGGTIATDHASGHTIEKGPDSFLTRKPGTLELVRQLGLEGSLIGVRSRRTYLYHAGKFHTLPPVSPQGIPTSVGALARSDLFGLGGKLRAGWDLLCPRSGLRPGEGDMSVGAFLRRRFGDQVVDRLVAPLAGGIHLTDVDLLSVQAVYPQLVELESQYRSLIRALSRRGPTSVPPGADSPFQTLRGGLETLVDSLVGQVGPVRLHLGTQVDSVNREGARWTLQGVRSSDEAYDQVILAVPPHAAGTVVSRACKDLALALGEIVYSGVVGVGLVYPFDVVPKGLEGNGFLVPKEEGLSLAGVTWIDRKWDYGDRAPGTAVRAYLSSAGQEPGDRDPEPDLLGRAQSDLRRAMGVEAEPTYAALYPHAMALPQYRVGHLDWVARVRRQLGSVPGLFLAGAAYEGVGLSDCIRSGRRAAKEARARGAGG